MELYPLLKLVHVFSAIVLMGSGFGTAFHLWFAHRSRDIHAIAVATKSAVLVEWLFTTPTVILQPLTGFWMLDLAGEDARQSWLMLAFWLFALAGVFWGPALWLKIRMRGLATICAARGTQLPAVFHLYLRWWFVLWSLIFIMTLVILALMVLRPTLWHG